MKNKTLTLIFNMSKELKTPKNVITSLRVNHGPRQEKLTTGLSGPRFFKKPPNKKIQGLNDCKPCTVKHETITEEKGRYTIPNIFIKTFFNIGEQNEMF